MTRKLWLVKKTIISKYRRNSIFFPVLRYFFFRMLCFFVAGLQQRDVDPEIFLRAFPHVMQHGKNILFPYYPNLTRKQFSPPLTKLSTSTNQSINPVIISTSTTSGMNYLREKFGSINGFLDEYGFDDTWRTKLRSCMQSESESNTSFISLPIVR